MSEPPSVVRQARAVEAPRFPWRNINGYGSHTLGFWNKDGERYWVKWHFKTNQGIQCVTNEEAATLPPHGAQQDLVDAIEQGDYPGLVLKAMKTKQFENIIVFQWETTEDLVYN
jgi:catalase